MYKYLPNILKMIAWNEMNRLWILGVVRNRNFLGYIFS